MKRLDIYVQYNALISQMIFLCDAMLVGCEISYRLLERTLGPAG